MTRDDIIRMAREAGLYDCIVFGRIESKDTVIERFAALVAAAERERLAQPEQEPVVWALPKMHPVMELRLGRRFRVR